jgi:hypothetical protein
MLSALYTALVTLTCGCGLQLGAGLRGASDVSHPKGTLEISGRVHNARRSGPYGSWATTATFTSEQLVSMHNITLGAGYRHVASDSVRIEFGLEVGVGEPALVDYQKAGLYVGGVSALLIRLPFWGEQHDNMLGTAPVGYAVDFVLGGRGGRWTRAMSEGGGGQWEAGVELALRLTVFSDLVVASDNSWEGPWDAR